MGISFEGIGQVLATFAVEDGVAEGSVVTMTANGTVGLGSGGSLPCGVLVTMEEDGMGAVQIEGMASVDYSGTAAPEAGYAMLACDGQGGVKTVESGGLTCLVVSVDEDSQTAVIKL